MVVRDKKKIAEALTNVAEKPHHKEGKDIIERETLNAASWSGSGSSPPDDRVPPDDIIEQFEQFCEDREIELLWELPDEFYNSPFRGNPCSYTNQVKWSYILFKEWSRYPRSYFGPRGKPVCELCVVLEQMVVQGNPGFFGVAVPQGKVIFINAQTKTEEIRHTLHHELYHLVDFVDDKEKWDDRSWTRLNPSGFEYTGEIRSRDPFNFDKAPQGFLMGYGTKEVYEDKAVFVGAIMDKPEIVKQKSGKDPVVDQKVNYIKKSLNHWCHSLSEAHFFTPVFNGVVRPFPEQYSPSASKNNDDDDDDDDNNQHDDDDDDDNDNDNDDNDDNDDYSQKRTNKSNKNKKKKKRTDSSSSSSAKRKREKNNKKKKSSSSSSKSSHKRRHGSGSGSGSGRGHRHSGSGSGRRSRYSGSSSSKRQRRRLRDRARRRRQREEYNDDDDENYYDQNGGSPWGQPGQPGGGRFNGGGGGNGMYPPNGGVYPGGPGGPFPPPPPPPPPFLRPMYRLFGSNKATPAAQPDGTTQAAGTTTGAEATDGKQQKPPTPGGKKSSKGSTRTPPPAPANTGGGWCCGGGGRPVAPRGGARADALSESRASPSASEASHPEE